MFVYQLKQLWVWILLQLGTKVTAAWKICMSTFSNHVGLPYDLDWMYGIQVDRPQWPIYSDHDSHYKLAVFPTLDYYRLAAFQMKLQNRLRWENLHFSRVNLWSAGKAKPIFGGGGDYSSGAFIKWVDTGTLYFTQLCMLHTHGRKLLSEGTIRWFLFA